MPFQERQSDGGLVASSTTVIVVAPSLGRTIYVTAVAGPMPTHRQK
jgi:hypothetical protein